jgi:hypothetical protein
MIPRILPVKCYNGILCAYRILHILFELINTNSVFEGDESRHYIGWYEVSCSLLLINLLTWVLEGRNARLPLTLLMTSWFVRPLPMSECFYCRSFLWHSSQLSLFHSWCGGSSWVCRHILHMNFDILYIWILIYCIYEFWYEFSGILSLVIWILETYGT